MQVLFTTKERNGIITEAHKVVPGTTREPTADLALIDTGFPTVRPEWDHNSTEVKEGFEVYHQTLLAGLKAMARWPTHVSKVYDVRQGPEILAAFLECPQETFRRYIPYDPEAPERERFLLFTFMNQAAPNIKEKLQKLSRVRERKNRNLMMMAERVFKTRENSEEKELRKEKDKKGASLTC